MENRPSLSGRLNLEASTTSTSSSSTSRENSISRTSSNSSLLSTKSVFEHNLSSILNNPHSSDASSWLGWWSSSSTSVIVPEFSPISTSKPELDSTKADFQAYLASISEHYSRFEDVRNHSSKESVDIENIGGQGEALVACLREVPALYFKEDFQLEDGATFKAACPFLTMNENLVLQERLSQYLDVVEMHLVKEISLRSNSFFEAQQQLGDLNEKIVEGCKRIRELKETIRLLEGDVVGSAKQIKEFSLMRNNLLALQQKLRLIYYVDQALGALKLVIFVACFWCMFEYHSIDADFFVLFALISSIILCSC